MVIPDSVTTIGDSAFRYCWEMKTLHLGSGLTTVEGYAFDRCEAAVTLSAGNRALVLENNTLFNAEKTRLIQYFEGPVETGRAEVYTIPTGVEEICDGAFDCCDNLKTVVIPSTVQRIGREAFGQCSNLVGLNIPASVTKIESSAFYCNKYPVHVAAGNPVYCSENGVVYSKNKDTLYYAGGAVGAYSILSGVVSIGDNAAAGAAITSLTLPASVERIGDGAFTFCEQLQTVTFLGSVKEIGGEAFSGCLSLTGVTIPEGVKTIRAYALAFCTGLRSVTIPKSVTTIEWSAFEACDALLDVYYAGSKTDWEQIFIEEDGNDPLWNAAIHYDGSTTVLVPDVVKLGKAEANAEGIVVTWEKAANAAWYNVYRKDAANTRWTVVATVRDTSYTDRDVEAGVKYTYTVRGVASDGKALSPSYDRNGVSAKATAVPENLGRGNCGAGGVDDSSVRWILTSDGTMTISGKGAMAMWGLDEHPWQEFRDQIRSVVIRPGVTTVGSYAFSGCFNLEMVEFPNTLTTIGEEAFADSNLHRVTIPDSVKTIQTDAFRWCPGLNYLHLGSGLATIGDSAFSSTNIISVTLAEDNKAFVLQNKILFTADKTKLVKCFDQGIANYVIPTGVKEIGAGAFDSCDNLKTVMIPSGVQRIGSGAFMWCYNLTSLTIPASVTNLQPNAFFTNTCPINVATANTVYCSRNGAVYTKNMDTLIYAAGARGAFTIPNTVVTIEENAFADSVISSVTIPNSVKTIGSWAFSNCGNLQTITLPAGVTEIGEGVFQVCTNLTSVRIPASVKTIQKWAFDECEALTDVYYGGTEADWKKISIEDGNDPLLNATLHTGGVFAPANVKLVGAKAVNGGIQVTWQAADGAAQYRVYRKAEGAAKWSIIAHTTGTSYVDKTAAAGVKYTYTVRGIAADGKTLSPSYDGNGVSATIPKTNAPANVTLTGAKVVTGGIQVTWQKANGAAQYRVYRKGPGETKWTGIINVTGTSWTDKTAKAGSTYTYTVRGIAKDGKTLSSSYDKIGVSAVIAPAKVVLVSAKADSAGILVTWQKAAGAHSYQVFRKTANTGWQRIAKNIHDTEWKDIDAVKGTKYFYTVRAVADDGTTRGAYDGTGKTATVTKNPTTPADVTLGKAVAGKSGITVTWSYAADARTYRVYRKAAGETKWTIVAKNAKGKSWTDKNVTKGVKYTYTVRGVNANGVLSSSYNGTGVSAIAK